jgi:hypothetical protein
MVPPVCGEDNESNRTDHGDTYPSISLIGLS